MLKKAFQIPASGKRTGRWPSLGDNDSMSPLAFLLALGLCLGLFQEQATAQESQWQSLAGEVV